MPSKLPVTCACPSVLLQRLATEVIAFFAVFRLVAMVMAMGAVRSARARFWAGVFALGWFSHGIMAAWSAPGVRGLAWLELLLALLVVALVSGHGVAARFGKRRAPR